MAWGAMLADATGIPFYIADTMPLSLLEKRTLSVTEAGGNGGIYNLFANDGAIRFVFVNSTASQGSIANCEAMMLNISTNQWQLWCRGPARTVNVYIFGYQYQPIPSWGIQINDAQGRCILTNETKVLRDVQNLGDSTDPNSSGYVFNTIISGQWAVAPAFTGYFSGVNNSGGGSIPVVAQFCTSARYNGNTTQIASGYLGNVDGSVSNATWTNYRNRLTAVNVERY